MNPYENRSERAFACSKLGGMAPATYRARAGGRWRASRSLLVGVLLACSGASLNAKATPNIVLWDTATPVQSADNRSEWKPVPVDLLSLETDPAKASSDPGYYGRAYTFKGDAVVENRSLTAVFWATRGRVVFYSKPTLLQPVEVGGTAVASGKQVAEFLPFAGDEQNQRITRVEIVRNAADEVVLLAFFSSQGKSEFSCRFSFGKSGLLEILPADSVKRTSLQSALRYAIAPSFVGDDLVFNPKDYSTQTNLYVPAENLLVGLGDGEQTEVVMLWPRPLESITLCQSGGTGDHGLFSGVQFPGEGKPLYLAFYNTPGIWHHEDLSSSFLEKDVELKWTRPFPAKWKTQLYEEGVRTTFAFRSDKGQIWRGVPGSYNYPAWFDGDKPFFHLSKKVPPKGEALIYFLEGQDTPVTLSTPADFLQESLGRSAAETVLDPGGRQLRTHHRRGGEGVRRACTCGCTEAIQAVFQKGEEATEQTYVSGALDDMIYFVHRHVERINEYQRFAAELSTYLKEQQKTAPELQPFVDSLQQILAQIPQEYEVQKENMKSFAYADDLARKTLALTKQRDTNNFNAYMDLLKAWRDMGGAQDYVLAQCHMITRKLCQEAGYGSVGMPAAAALAFEVRKRCKQCLRNPDGYEIWADY